MPKKKTTHAAGAAEVPVNANTIRLAAHTKLRGARTRRALPTVEAITAEADRRHAMHMLGDAKLRAQR